MNTLLSKPAPMPYDRPELGTTKEAIHAGLLAYFQRWLDRSDLQFEMRFLSTGGGGGSGAFFNLEPEGLQAAAELVFQQDSNPKWRGIYCTINPAPRTTAARGVLGKKLTKDADILEGRCHSLLLDLDPVRPEGFGTWNATASEVAWAHAAGTFILDLLPLIPSTISHSGNGFQAIYPLEGISAEDHKLVLGWLDSCLQEDGYLSGKAQVDTKVYNPSRIWRVIGTHGRKLGNGVDRPSAVRSILLREPARPEDLPRMLSDNQQEIETLISEIKAEREKAPPKIASVERSTPKVTEEPSKKAGGESLILKVSATDWMERAKRYVAKIKPGVEGQNGSGSTFAAACKIIQKFKELDESQHWSLLNIYNSESCQPPWSEKELLHKFRDAQIESAKNPIHEPFTEETFEQELPSNPPGVAEAETGVAVTVAPTAPEPWPELKHQEKSLPEPKEFPLDALPRTAKDFCLAVSEAQGCDPAFPGILSIACMAGAIGASHELMVKPGWTELPVFWLALIARPGTGKTPAANAVFAPLRSIQKRFTEEFRDKLSRYKSDLERRRTSKDGAMELPSKPARQTLLFQNITVESLVTELQNSPRGMVCVADELSFWVKSMNAYRAGGDREWFLSSWSSTPVDYFRKTSETAIYIPRPCVSICGSIQPAKLSLLHGGQDDGFLSRFLVCHPREVKARYSKEGLSVFTQRSWEDFIARLWNLEPEAATDLEMFPRTLALSPDAHGSFQNFFDRVQDALQGDAIPDIVRGSWSKAPSVVARLSLVIHLGKMVEGFGKCDEVSQKSVSQAIELSDYFLEHSTRLSGSFEQGQSSADKLRRSILGWIERNRVYLMENKGFEWSKVRHDLRESIPKNRDGVSDDRALEQALDGLEATGHIRAVQVVKPKKKPCYEINPLILGSGSIHLSKYPPPPGGGFNQCQA